MVLLILLPRILTDVLAINILFTTEQLQRESVLIETNKLVCRISCSLTGICWILLVKKVCVYLNIQLILKHPSLPT